MQVLPDSMPKTPMIAWTGKLANGSLITCSPGPLIRVPVHKKISIVWENNISGRPILPIDTTICPDMDVTTYTTQIPIIIHAHGISVTTYNDGRPLGYFTINGTQGPNFRTSYNYSNNSAVFNY